MKRKHDASAHDPSGEPEISTIELDSPPSKRPRLQSTSFASPELHTELSEYIFSFLTPKELGRVSAVNKEFHSYANSNRVWDLVAQRYSLTDHSSKRQILTKANRIYDIIQKLIVETTMRNFIYPKQIKSLSLEFITTLLTEPAKLPSDHILTLYFLALHGNQELFDSIIKDGWKISTMFLCAALIGSEPEVFEALIKKASHIYSCDCALLLAIELGHLHCVSSILNWSGEIGIKTFIRAFKPLLYVENGSLAKKILHVLVRNGLDNENCYSLAKDAIEADNHEILELVLNVAKARYDQKEPFDKKYGLNMMGFALEMRSVLTIRFLQTVDINFESLLEDAKNVNNIDKKSFLHADNSPKLLWIAAKALSPIASAQVDDAVSFSKSSNPDFPDRKCFPAMSERLNSVIL